MLHFHPSEQGRSSHAPCSPPGEHFSSLRASKSQQLYPSAFLRSYQNCLWMNSACLSCLWNLRGVAAIKPRLLPSPTGLLVCTECSLNQSCLVLSQATLSNKIQRQGHPFPPHPFQIFLITSFETASSLKSHFSAKFVIGVLCRTHSTAGVTPGAFPTPSLSSPNSWEFHVGRGSSKGNGWDTSWTTCQAWHCLLPMKRIFGKSSEKTLQRTGGWKPMGGGNLWGVLSGR